MFVSDKEGDFDRILWDFVFDIVECGIKDWLWNKLWYVSCIFVFIELFIKILFILWWNRLILRVVLGIWILLW